MICKYCNSEMRLEQENFTGDSNCEYADTYLVKAEKGKFEFKRMKGSDNNAKN